MPRITAAMNIVARRLRTTTLLTVLLFCGCLARAETFRVATYNLENYIDEATDTRYVKAAESKAKVRESILALKPDVLAMEEMGSTNALLELRDSLKAQGLDLPYWEHVTGFDTNIHVAILSKFPFAARRPHVDDSYLLSGRRFRVSRGFAEVDIQVNPNYSFTLLVAHLKSKRPIPTADEAEMRLEEAKLLRDKVSAHLVKNADANIVVVGDFNDTKDSESTKAVIGRGKTKLVDTRPAERNGDNVPSPNPAWDPRNITWTHFYGKEDTYSRIDYILASPGMAREWVTNETYVLTMPNWGVASDHRPIVATFEAADR
jgi:endonuclease/exonuclease/phosphatase family metal-dependent hydrolase